MIMYILRNVIDSIKKYYTRGVVLLISNPVDILTYEATEWMNLLDGYLFGTEWMLDTSRFARGVALSFPSAVGSSGVLQRIKEKSFSGEYREFLIFVESIREVSI